MIITMPNARVTVVAHFSAGDREKTRRADGTWLADLLVRDWYRYAWLPGQGGCPRARPVIPPCGWSVK